MTDDEVGGWLVTSFTQNTLGDNNSDPLVNLRVIKLNVSENKASHAAQHFIQYVTPTTSLKSVGLVKFLATMTQS